MSIASKARKVREARRKIIDLPGGYIVYKGCTDPEVMGDLLAVRVGYFKHRKRRLVWTRALFWWRDYQCDPDALRHQEIRFAGKVDHLIAIRHWREFGYNCKYLGNYIDYSNMDHLEFNRRLKKIFNIKGETSGTE